MIQRYHKEIEEMEQKKKNSILPAYHQHPRLEVCGILSQVTI